MALASQKSLKVVGQEKFLQADSVRFGSARGAKVGSSRAMIDWKRSFKDDSRVLAGKLAFEIVAAPQEALDRVAKEQAKGKTKAKAKSQPAPVA